MKKSRGDEKTSQSHNPTLICQQKSQQLEEVLIKWLNSKDFEPIKQQLEKQFTDSNSPQILIKINNPELQKLPWHLWDVFQGREVALSYTIFCQGINSANITHLLLGFNFLSLGI